MVRKILSLMVVIVVVSLSVNITVSADIQITDINSGWHWPTSSSIRTITSEFGRVRTNTIHQAIDIDGKTGDPVYATRDGDVVESFSSCKGSHEYGECSCSGGQYYGNYVVIYHGTWNGNKIYSMYMHLDSVSIKSGTVKARQQIGTMGNTGPSQGDHLHFQISKGSKNPSHSNITLARNNFINTNPSKAMFLNGTFSHNRIGNDSYPYSEYGNITYIMDGGNVVPPDTEAPTNVVLSINKSLFAAGETVCFSASSQGAKGYTIGIYRNGERIYTGDVNSIYETSFSESGIYTAYITAWNNIGSVDSSNITFTIYSDIGANFYAYIGHQATGKWLSNTNGNIEGSNPTGNTNQIWNFIRQPDGSYIIKNMLDNSYMDVWGTSTETGTNVYCCSTYTGDVNQRFFIYHMYGAYYFRPVYTNMHLDMSSVTYNLELWGAGEDWAPQEFNIQIIDENGYLPQNVGEEFYAYIGHQSTGKWLANVNGNIEGSNLTGDNNQIWHFIRQFDGSYVIKNMLDNSYMDVWGTSTEVGANIYCCSTYTGDVNQRFFIYHMYDAYYFRPVYTNMHLDMSSITYNLELWGAGVDWEPQEFNIQIIDENGYLPQNIGNNFFATIKNVSLNKYLTNNAGNIEGKNELSNLSQLWNFVRQADGSYIIKNMFDNSYMDVWGTSTETGTNIYCCSAYTGDVNQRFFIYHMYDAYYFRPVYTNMHLDMSSITYNLELWGAGVDWEPQEFEIKKHELNSEIHFQAENATNVPETIKKIYGSTVTISDMIPIKENYKFLNWNTRADGMGTSYNVGDTYTTNESVTLYAQWENLIPYTDSIVIKNGSSYYVNVVPVNIEESCEVIVAAYKGGKFVTLTSTPYNQIAISTTLSGDIDEIKVMAWNSLSGLKPLCDAEVIPSSEFIIE